MSDGPTVHVVEPGGRGGINHHAASLAGALAAAGVPVVFHTAADAEERPAGVETHLCLWRYPGLRPPFLRRLTLVAGWLARGVPSCAVRFRGRDVVHVEGWFRPVLLVPLVLAARARRCRVVLAPHTTFSRSCGPTEVAIMRSITRRADAVITFSEADRQEAVRWRAAAVRTSLVPDAPRPDPVLVDAWRRRWSAGPGSDRRVLLFAGLVRPDKGLDVLVRAAATAPWREDLILAVVGEDGGALAGARRLAEQLGVTMAVDDRYQPLEQLVAAVQAADVVACPYRRASQSGVLSLATSLGRPTVATDVGGLPELATVVVPPDDPDALAAAVEKAIGAPPRPAPTWAEVLPAYLGTYGLAP